LWHLFDRFAQVVDGLDPVKEKLRPFYFETDDLRVYGLKGNKTFLLWCRDKQNSWQTELRDGIPPRTITGAVLALGRHSELDGSSSARAFDPWMNKWKDLATDHGKITLPDFQRSIVVRGTAK
jgi:hypothetical protein